MRPATLEEKLWHPCYTPHGNSSLFLGLLLLGLAWSAFAWITQLRNGLEVTGMRDIPAVRPGVYMANFIFFIGITTPV